MTIIQGTSFTKQRFGVLFTTQRIDYFLEIGCSKNVLYCTISFERTHRMCIATWPESLTTGNCIPFSNNSCNIFCLRLLSNVAQVLSCFSIDCLLSLIYSVDDKNVTGTNYSTHDAELNPATSISCSRPVRIVLSHRDHTMWFIMPQNCSSSSTLDFVSHSNRSHIVGLLVTAALVQTFHFLLFYGI